MEQAVWGAKACLALDVGDAQADIVEVLGAIPVGDPIRVVIVTRAPTVREAVSVMKRGAVDYLQKPVTERALTAALQHALDESESACSQLESAQFVRDRLTSLSPTEQEVLAHLARGATTSEIARALHRSERTIGNHRQHILNKMGARNTIELINMLKSPLRDNAEAADQSKNGSICMRPKV